MVLLVTIIATSLAGPFDTLAVMGPVMRFVYWGAVLPPSFFLQFYISMWLREYARRTGRPWGLAAFLAGLIGSIPILGWVLVINATIADPYSSSSLLQLAEYTVSIVVLMTVAVNAFMPTLQPLWGFRKRTHRVVSQAAPAPDAEVSPFFDRLPPDLGRNVVCIKAANHHLEVTTTRGHARVLMRLADAEADLAELTGARVHRSWWVNLAHVARTEARPGGLDLVLNTGLRIPVSRAQRARIDAYLEQDAAE